MSYLSNEVSRFAKCLDHRYNSGFHVLDDIFAVIVFTGFSVIQTQLLYRLGGHLRNGDFKSSSRTGPWFGIAHITLGAGYLICALLAVANFMMKLGLVSQHTALYDQNWLCPPSYSDSGPFRHLYICFDNGWTPLLTATKVLDFILGVFFQLMLLLSDGLLLYRCFILFEKPWAIAVMVAAASRLGWFIFVAATHFTGHNSAVITTYVSLLTTLLTSTALVIWLWQERSKAKASTEINQVSYGESIGIVLKAALPPIVLGFVHIWLFANITHVLVGLNAFWFSFTVLASQTITLSTFEQGDRGIMNGKPDRAISLPSSE
ncbi:hypothetical protein BKA70DRAFT_1280303 [Coprinopsis sp. MPI-PUGE-AT-0042]|nr:hypothetical protein BKA70DRAFT_1280303 [Coprinopsis sp. MPI-PUGE-AT-0042]